MLFAAKKCDPLSAYDWACTALKGLALQSLVTYHGGKEWEELKLFLLTRFKPLSFNVEVRQSLHELKMHQNDLEKYLHEFHELGLQVPNMGDAESIYMFCHKRSEILTPVTMEEPGGSDWEGVAHEPGETCFSCRQQKVKITCWVSG